jgi:hypothetical protein
MPGDDRLNCRLSEGTGDKSVLATQRFTVKRDALARRSFGNIDRGLEPLFEG